MLMCFPTKSIVFIFERMKQSDELLYITIVAKKKLGELNWRRTKKRNADFHSVKVCLKKLKKEIEASIE